ncbi:MAG: tRNA 2-thiouridine(34) synthase MnmA [Dysgonamonadaceae bacterium]|jgi:tRNA-specific 2-thiouridylase|nr:tRNA 2-thiouridine(34) synthase MnmA [Dysgonamonadaceae bacterium]
MTIAALVSGGVDSSVAVALLKEAGYTPTIFYIRIGKETDDQYGGCTWEEDTEITAYIAKKYGCRMETVTLTEEYWDQVITYTIDSVKRGFTPNPDIMCNKLIKFGVFNDRWGKDFDQIATGHYATITRQDGKTYLSTAADRVKDQTYFLGQIDNPQISKLIFPIGHLQKSEVRRIAANEQLPSADRKDSQGICFLGKINYNDFLRHYLGTLPGKIIEYETGKILGEHDGYWFHTIGQRKGLHLGGGPWFVVSKDISQNIIYASRTPTPTLNGNRINLQGFHFITHSPWPAGPENTEITFKIRHTPEFTSGILSRVGDTYVIEPDEEIHGIAAGQFGVVYDRNSHICIGSGMIINTR